MIKSKCQVAFTKYSNFSRFSSPPIPFWRGASTSRQFFSFVLQMDNKGLLFVPDISGFTRFVNETEIEHSRLIIQELLERLINANELGLEVSEVEGDAILFYKFGEPPALGEIFKQVEGMFCAFHESLTSYEIRKYCQCTACTSAINLTLKVVTHYGEFTGYRVKHFNKLIGKDVIVVHQLLKNEIQPHEYWLVTRSLLADDKPSLAEWMEWNEGVRETDNGTVPFRYTMLSPLKTRVLARPIPPPDFKTLYKVASVTQDYNTDIIRLFHATGDFNNRHLWKEGISRVEEVAHFLPRVGMRCRCILDTGETLNYTSSYYQYQVDRIEFCETEDRKKHITHFLLEKIDDNLSRLTLEVYFPRNLRGTLSLLTGRRKVQRDLGQSAKNLVGFNWY